MFLNTVLVSVVVMTSFIGTCTSSGPVYPVTAAWFKDRFSLREWNTTLAEFTSNGGDTVLLRSPPILPTSLEELRSNPEFQWCVEETDLPFKNRTMCYDAALNELSSLGLEVAMFGTYLNEEDFDASAMLQCPQYDRLIVSSRIYYRIVLPLDPERLRTPCNLTGSKVLVLLTSYSGIDPHGLLLESAQAYNTSVYFGLPLPPISYSTDEIMETTPFIEFVRRVTLSHHAKYNSENGLNTPFKGYTYAPPSDILSLSSMGNLQLLKLISTHTKAAAKKLLLNTYFQTNMFIKNGTIASYSQAFEVILRSGYTDVISIQDGRGNANGGYFWSTQVNTAISKVDKDLFNILNAKFPDLVSNVTYSEVFWASINQMFFNFAAVRERLLRTGVKTNIWLNIEAFSDLHDDPCLPVDRSGSGLAQMMNRVSKARLDLALTHTGAYVQKVAALAWDPSFTCTTKNLTNPLSRQVSNDLGRPIIANCSFHSSFNRSVVIIGYNLLGETQGFTVNWPREDGGRVKSQVHGYYFETEWGLENGRVPSLIYTQLYDPYDILTLAHKGYVIVTAESAFHACAFSYDFRNDVAFKFEKMKLYHYFDRKPRRRVFGRNTPRL